MRRPTVAEVYGRIDRNGHVHLFDDKGLRVTTLADVHGIFPIGSDRGVYYDHPYGIVISREDTRRLNIRIAGNTEDRP